MEIQFPLQWKTIFRVKFKTQLNFRSHKFISLLMRFYTGRDK
ncbi:hypothetical protein yberc0001_3910 [Yersinia bercovieri ATCC 43970]|uniref:Uncharacterized protein n=1 Tax=Yersinia bercovieri ATCC 43970 TaxID=349968 RepID=A0ABP2E681_YERBE|nr:hypothetical protein yberc0001_3910 [Yersinia bercovieri ATCC 43970]